MGIIYVFLEFLIYWLQYCNTFPEYVVNNFLVFWYFNMIICDVRPKFMTHNSPIVNIFKIFTYFFIAIFSLTSYFINWSKSPLFSLSNCTLAAIFIFLCWNECFLGSWLPFSNSIFSFYPNFWSNFKTLKIFRNLHFI